MGCKVFNPNIYTRTQFCKHINPNMKNRISKQSTNKVLNDFENTLASHNSEVNPVYLEVNVV
jgi:hypothetical protein